MTSGQTTQRGATIVKQLALVVVAGVLSLWLVSTAHAQRPPGVPNIPTIPTVPTTPSTPPVTTPPPETITVPTPRIVGSQPDATQVVPNTHVILQQSRTTDFNDNFLTEDWGKGRNLYGARSGRIKRIRPASGAGGNTAGGTAVTPPSEERVVLIAVDGTPTDARVDALAQRHRLARIESQNFPLIAATVFRWSIPDNRSVDAVLRELATDPDVRRAQRNMHYITQDAGVHPPAEGSPEQYALAKLHLPEAHLLARGTDVAIAVIDSGIDVTHPELAGTIIGTFDALNSKEGAHPHGTGVAGTIAAHGQLIGAAPGARILAIRAFAANPKDGADSTSFVVMRAISYAVQQHAQVINMSFAGPADPLVQEALAACAARGIVLVAAAGNAGPNSPPLYPAADNHVIAVTATDSADRLFAASNRGAQISIAAPGVDILMPAPDDKYQVKSGTSFAAAYISGLAALLIDRNPGITPDGVRAALTATAHDLGPKGRDDQFGAGLADARAAVEAVSRSLTAGAKTDAVAPPQPAR
jgi:hypothetical protein